MGEAAPKRQSDSARASLRAVKAVDDFAALLKKFRTEAGLSQQTLAERALISVQAISALERGYRKAPYRDTVDRIADALELSEEAREHLQSSTERSRGPRHTAEHGTMPAHNLPRQLTSFLGRDLVVAHIVELLDTTPLVSIVGTGGAGKTRTAIEVGNRLATRFAQGVWFVELAPLHDPSLVPHALAEALHVQESPARPLLETLIAYLRQRELLVILDNCEHVISETRLLAGAVLRECPGVTLLTTSREPLKIAGERTYRIPSLSVPEATSTPEVALQYGAVALFDDRVRATDATFAVTAENVGSVIEICRRLDGLPLALELAAARASVLSPQQICERLDRVFDVLIEGSEGDVPRHATMRAVIDWSYDLLSSQAQRLFERLATFAGGFTLETATTVCTDDSLARKDVLQSLSALITQSLVMVDFSHGAARYQLQEATKQYALERLIAREERHAQARRHALAFLEVAERLDEDWYSASERLWFNEAEAELDNFRAALVWSLGERGDLHLGGLLAGALARLWYSLAPVEGRRWVRLAIDSMSETLRAEERAQLYIADAELCGALGESKASLAAAERALRLRGVFDDLQLARAEHAAGAALAALGQSEEGEALLDQVLTAGYRLHNARLQALVLSDLGTAHSRRGDIAGARRFYSEARAGYVALGLERPAASIAGHLAELEFEAGDPATALYQAEEARTGHAATRNRRSEAADLCNIAAYLIALDCFGDARAAVSRALDAAHDVCSPVLTAFVLQHAAAVGALHIGPDGTATVKDMEDAAMLLGYVETRLRELGARRDYTERQEQERLIAALRHAFGERLEQLTALGSQWNEDFAIAVAREL